MRVSSKFSVTKQKKKEEQGKKKKKKSQHVTFPREILLHAGWTMGESGPKDEIGEKGRGPDVSVLPNRVTLEERTFPVYRSAGGWSQTWALQMGGPGRGALGSRGGNARPCRPRCGLLRMREEDGKEAAGERRRNVRGEEARGEGGKGAEGKVRPGQRREGGDDRGIRGGRERGGGR